MLAGIWVLTAARILVVQRHVQLITHLSAADHRVANSVNIPISALPMRLATTLGSVAPVRETPSVQWITNLLSAVCVFIPTNVWLMLLASLLLSAVANQPLT